MRLQELNAAKENESQFAKNCSDLTDAQLDDIIAIVQDSKIDGE